MWRQTRAPWKVTVRHLGYLEEEPSINKQKEPQPSRGRSDKGAHEIMKLCPRQNTVRKDRQNSVRTKIAAKLLPVLEQSTLVTTVVRKRRSSPGPSATRWPAAEWTFAEWSTGVVQRDRPTGPRRAAGLPKHS